MELLNRDNFREGVFKRDNHKCVICGDPAKDAHHIIERRLFDNGGYFLENGASLCHKHHLEAEMTTLSCNEIRKAAGIERICLPSHLYSDIKYDKWGNPISQNGTRIKGELFDDHSVQKILKEGNVLHLFTDKVKYPRTYHLPFSPGLTKDDRQIESCDQFVDKEVVVTLKMDGENTSMGSDYIHARSLEYNSHPSRDRVKAFHSQICYNIPEGWRICGENLFAKHSILYKNLKHFFYVFSIWNEKNECLSWDETVEWCQLLELEHVDILFRGIWDEGVIRGLYSEYDNNGNEMEGYVVRLSESFHYCDFRKSVAKYVREDHVNTSHHWKFEKIVPNIIEKI